MSPETDEQGGSKAGGLDLLEELRQVAAARCRSGRELDSALLAGIEKRADRRKQLLARLRSEVRCWVARNLLSEAAAGKIENALASEESELTSLVGDLQRPLARPEIPVARLVPPEEIAAERSAGGEATGRQKSSDRGAGRTEEEDAGSEAPAAAEEAQKAPAAAVSASQDEAGPEARAEDGAPWYTVERNLRILANLGILVFNIGLVGFITSAWGGWQDGTKVAVLVGYTVLLLAGGYLLRLRTKLKVSGTALLALGVLGVPIDFFSLHFYELTTLSRSALGLMGAGACLVATLAVAVRTRESLFCWLAYLASIFGAGYFLDLLQLRFEVWPAPMIVLFGAFMAVGAVAWRRGIDRESRLGLLAAPAEAVAVAGASLVLLAHLASWLVFGRIQAGPDPAAVIWPLAACACFFTGLAVLRRRGAILGVVAGLKVLILGAALRSLGVAGHEWPVYYMLFGVLLVASGGLFSGRVERQWLLPHCAAGWAAAGLSLLLAAVSYLADLAGLRSPAGMASGDVFILTAAPPLIAGIACSLLRRDLLPVVLSAVLATLETALLLERFEIAYFAVPLSFALLAALMGTAGALLQRSGDRFLQGRALGAAADVVAGLALACLLTRIELFWSVAGARWAMLFFGVVCGSYVARSLLGRISAMPALTSFFMVLVFGCRSLGLHWSVQAPVLAGGALLTTLAMIPVKGYRQPAFLLGQVAGGAAIVLSFFVYWQAGASSHWGLLAVALVAGLHLASAVIERKTILEYTGLGIAGAGMILGAYELGMPPARLGLAALGLPVAYRLLALVSWRLELPVFRDSPAASAALGSGIALALTISLGGSSVHVFPGIAALVLLATCWLIATQAVGEDLREYAGAAISVLGSAMLIATAGLLVIWRGESLWPQLALAAVGVFHAYRALARGERWSEYAAMTVGAAAYLLVFPEFEMEASRYGMVAMALPLAFYGVSAVGRELGWKSFVESSFDMVVPGSAAVLVLSLLAWLGGAVLAVVVSVAALLLASFLSASRGRAESRWASYGHCAAALMMALGVGVQVIRKDAAYVPELVLVVLAALQVLAALDRQKRALEYSSMMLFGVAYLLLLRDLGLKAEQAGLAAMALPAAYQGLSLLGGRLGWSRFVDSAFDVSVPAAAAVLVLTLMGWVSWTALVIAVLCGSVLSTAFLVISGAGGSHIPRSTGAALAAAALVAAAWLQVEGSQVFLLPVGALGLTALLQVLSALRRRSLVLEYTSLVLAAGAFLLAFRDAGLSRERYCLIAAAVPLGCYALSLVARGRSWPRFSKSAYDLSLPAACLALGFAFAFSLGKPASRSVWYTADLWHAIGTASILGSMYMVQSYVRSPRRYMCPAVANFLGTGLLVVAYLLTLRVFSRGTPYRALWIMAAAPACVAYGALLFSKDLARRGLAAGSVGIGVSAGALFQALLFPDRPLVAALAFAMAAVLYGLVAAILGSGWFGAAASAALSVAYFSLIRHMAVPAESYVLWLVGLGLLQSLVGGPGGRAERQRRPAMFTGMLISIGSISWMIYRGEVYFSRGGPEIDVAIWTILGAAGVFALVAVLQRSRAAAYPAAVALLGGYYLVLHRFAVSWTEFYTVPIALMAMAWSRLFVRRKWGKTLANFAAGVSLALLLVPSLALSLDRHSPDHLGHMLWAFGLSVASVLAGMGMRRKVYLGAGLTGFACEALVKLYHFKLEYDVSDWIWLLLVGVVILGFVLYAETRRNKQLKAHAEEARARLAKVFASWE